MMNGKNQPLVTDEPVELTLKNKWLKCKTSQELPIILEESTEHVSIFKKKLKPHNM